MRPRPPRAFQAAERVSSDDEPSADCPASQEDVRRPWSSELRKKTAFPDFSLDSGNATESSGIATVDERADSTAGL